MDPDFFVRLAQARKCNSTHASKSIRKHAIKKNGDGHNSEDANLLPFMGTLRRTENGTDDGQGAFSVGRITTLLRCKCAGVCEPQTTSTSDQDDTRLANMIYNDDSLLKLFVTLCLSGCLFAARTLIRNDFADIDSMPEIIEHVDRHELRVRLFAPFQKFLTTCPHRPSHAENHIMCLAKTFSSCLGHRIWLTRIPKFGRTGEIHRYSRRNMPFTEESEPQQARQNRRFFKFKIAKDYYTEDSEDLRDVFLFRKQMRFENDEHYALRAEAQEEYSILSLINDMKHDSIVELLCAYEESRSDHLYVNLIFPWYEYDLASILYGRAPSENLTQGITPEFPESVLDCKLWKGLLGVVDAVKVIHSPQNEHIPNGDLLIGSHFDIKPANILVSEDNKLILADFGQAHLKPYRPGQDTALTARPGTLDYAPPTSSNGAAAKLNRSYDVWSLGCVILEVLVFLALGGTGAFRAFHLDRYNEERSGDQMRSAAFWVRGVDGKPALCKAVRNRLLQLKNISQRLGNQTALRPVVEEVQAMLSVDERFRPTISSALQKFKAEGDIDLGIFVSKNEREVMKRKLKEMHTSFTTERLLTPLSCELFLWRDIARGGDLEKMRLIISGTSAGSYGERTLVRSDTFIPVSYFDPNTKFISSFRSENMMRCKFEELHRAATLHFHKAKDFFDFQAMLTYQSLHYTKGTPMFEAIKLTFTSCTLQVHQRMGSKEVTYSAGRIQIWRTLQEKQFQLKYETDVDSMHEAQGSSSSSFGNSSPRGSLEVLERPPTTSTSASQRRPSRQDQPRAKFKMAIFTFDPCRRACIVMDLNPNNYVRMDMGEQYPKGMTFKREKGYDNFPVAIFGWRGGENAASDSATMPGVPLSPAVLEYEILNGVRIRSLGLEMEDSDGRQRLKNLYEGLWRHL